MSIINTTNSQLSTSERLFSEIRHILVDARKTTYKAINFAMVTAYWNIGRLIVEDEQQGLPRAKYGKAILADLSQRLTNEFGKGFDERELRRIRQFYLVFPKRDALRPELTWTHYRLLIRVQNEGARLWYMNEAAEQTWSSRQLDRQISVLYYERLLNSVDTIPVRKEAEQNLKQLTPQEFIHDPYVLEFLSLKNYPALRETNIENALISNLQEFLLELGKLTHQDVGQMDSYIRMFDDLYKHPDDNPTLGLILCSDKNEAVVKYSVLSEHRQIFASKYILELPTPELLQKEIIRERNQLDSSIKI